ncbi:CHAP domain-containing protein [Nocardiaceae bacterium YC2-7]|uniref:CHAP domain-containing protein n=2 Tax=Antrihabitans stalactiti TaxID=2584121 RepID=A0A848KMY2_9NOCA|nr:CHAP domain-containing protein [Antrihabitans stalactiti]
MRGMITKSRILLGVAAVVLAAIAALTWSFAGNIPTLFDEDKEPFPHIETSSLDDRQARVVDVLRAEFAAPGAGEKYSEGITEPWCADFVSWVMREAGQPLANPNSESWRIPGVFTLQEFYEQSGRFAPVGYQPRPGDVVLYSEDSRFGQHTNIVVANDNGTIKTVGGNEGGIRVRTLVIADEPGIVGFGRL